MEIYLTLDYELFMGERTGSVDNSLITPTNNLCSVLNKYGVKATFFVDAAYLYRLYELKDEYSELNNDFSKISNQLKELQEDGHDIQLHIHPQWYNASYDGNGWILEEKYYKLSDLPLEQAKDVFVRSKKLLEGIKGKAITAFRAGGYSIQSFPDVKGLFTNAEIKVDSSVLSHKSAKTGPQSFDYSHIPNNTLYKFSDDLVKEDSEGQFYEIPITTSRISLFDFLRSYLRYKKTPLSHKTFGDGSPAHIASLRKNRWQRLLSEGKEYRAASIDNGGVMFLPSVYKHCKGNDRFVIIGHPKNLSKASLKVLDEFLMRTSREDTYIVVNSIK